MMGRPNNAWVGALNRSQHFLPRGLHCRRISRLRSRIRPTGASQRLHKLGMNAAARALSAWYCWP